MRTLFYNKAKWLLFLVAASFLALAFTKRLKLDKPIPKKNSFEVLKISLKSQEKKQGDKKPVITKIVPLEFKKTTQETTSKVQIKVPKVKKSVILKVDKVVQTPKKSKPQKKKFTKKVVKPTPKAIKIPLKSLKARFLGSKNKPLINYKNEVLSQPPPIYPRRAKDLMQQGTTILLIKVLANGAVGDIQVDKSSGYSLLDKASLRAVKKWRFKNNKYRSSRWVRIPMQFLIK